MVTRSRAREGRGISVILETQFEPETGTQQEQEIQVSMPTTCEEGLGAARQFPSDTASQYITADTPEATATFRISQEISPEFSTESQISYPHISLRRKSVTLSLLTIGLDIAGNSITRNFNVVCHML